LRGVARLIDRLIGLSHRFVESPEGFLGALHHKGGCSMNLEQHTLEALQQRILQVALRARALECGTVNPAVALPPEVTQQHPSCDYEGQRSNTARSRRDPSHAFSI
jgi:hypothetical protein